MFNLIMTSKKPFLFIMIVLLFFLQGCLKINVTLNVGSDGKGVYENVIDFSGMFESNASSQNLDRESFNVHNICDTLREGQTFSIEWDKTICNPLADYRVKLTSTVNLIEEKQLKIEDAFFARKYVLTLEVFNATTLPQDPQELKASGMIAILNIVMPGEIKSTTAGKISENKKLVSIDVLEDYEQLSPQLVVVSEESKLIGFVFAFIGGIFLLFFLGFILFAWKNRNMV